MYYPNIFDEHLYNDLFNEVLNFPVDYSKRLRNELVDKRRCTTDIKEYEDRYELEMEFPGYDKSEIKAELKNGYLIVSAEHIEQKESGEAPDGEESKAAADVEADTGAAETDNTIAKEPIKYICRERFYGKTERNFYVGKTISKDDIKAQYANGVLTLVIPKEVNKQENESEIISITD